MTGEQAKVLSIALLVVGSIVSLYGLNGAVDVYNFNSQMDAMNNMSGGQMGEMMERMGGQQSAGYGQPIFIVLAGLGMVFGGWKVLGGVSKES